jgi:hypothetical protein
MERFVAQFALEHAPQPMLVLQKNRDDVDQDGELQYQAVAAAQPAALMAS